MGVTVEFESDADQERANIERHGIDVTAAATVFGELLVSYSERADRIRMISARPASSRERRPYESGR
jgi:uncharacterized DUF497 family protein